MYLGALQNLHEAAFQPLEQLPFGCVGVDRSSQAKDSPTIRRFTDAFHDFLNSGWTPKRI
jgi:hypothetical protein